MRGLWRPLLDPLTLALFPAGGEGAKAEFPLRPSLDPNPLLRDIDRFVRGSEGGFDDLARRAFALQYERVEPFRRLCDARGVGPHDPWDWRRVPAVPTTAFRSLPLHVAEPREVFRSSGTTGGPGSRSVHRHPFPDLYRTVIDASFPQACLVEESRRPILSLVPSREQAPDSSLGFMCDYILQTWGSDGSRTAFGDDGVDLDVALSFLRERAAGETSAEPVTILSTAFALAQLLDGLEAETSSGGAVRLVDGSTMMETGGFKGRRRELSRTELLRRVDAALGLQPDRVVREYGMTELTGHVYTDVLQGGDPDVFRVPHWMRVRLLHPETLEEVAGGQEGLVAFFDLANVGSVLHVVSQDVGVAEGDSGIRLLGRAEGADLRGCSLVVEELTVDGPVVEEAAG